MLLIFKPPVTDSSEKIVFIPFCFIASEIRLVQKSGSCETFIVTCVYSGAFGLRFKFTSLMLSLGGLTHFSLYCTNESTSEFIFAISIKLKKLSFSSHENLPLCLLIISSGFFCTKSALLRKLVLDSSSGCFIISFVIVSFFLLSYSYVSFCLPESILSIILILPCISFFSSFGPSIGLTGYGLSFFSSFGLSMGLTGYGLSFFKYISWRSVLNLIDNFPSHKLPIQI